MKFPLSISGAKLASRSGILELMDDLGEAMSGASGEFLMMGGGNPAEIPEVAAIWRRRLGEILADGPACDRMLVNYDGPAGSPAFREAFAACLRRRYGWGIGPENIAVTNGGQTAFFFLFNMLAGEFPDGSIRKIVLPLVPEYIGYANQGMSGSIFTTCLPRIHRISEHRFKYQVDFENLQIGPDAAAICVSRPTNPTGNVLTAGELNMLAAVARARRIPLIVDSAYGAPFPNAVFEEVNPFWNEDVILTFSLSKLGLPGTRTGIVVAEPSIIEQLAAMTSVVGLANNNIGQAITRPLFENDDLLRISRDLIQPYYRRKSQQALEIVDEAFAGRFPYEVHASEGAFFLWIRFPGLSITSRSLYHRLKKRRVLIIPGEYFFNALDRDWAHATECIRGTLSQSEDVVRRGVAILADEVAALSK